MHPIPLPPASWPRSPPPYLKSHTERARAAHEVGLWEWVAAELIRRVWAATAVMGCPARRPLTPPLPRQPLRLELISPTGSLRRPSAAGEPLRSHLPANPTVNSVSFRPFIMPLSLCFAQEKRQSAKKMGGGTKWVTD